MSNKMAELITCNHQRSLTTLDNKLKFCSGCGASQNLTDSIPIWIFPLKLKALREEYGHF